MILCVNPHCRAFGRHQPDCQVECRGCLPRQAADGRNLCEICTRRLAEDAQTAAQLYADLEEVLIATGRGGLSVSGTRDHGLELNERAAECRTLIRHRLVSWSLLIAEERGFAVPANTVGALAAFVVTSSVWLSAHPAANDAAEELHDLAHGLPWRTAYPSGVRRYPVAACPMCPGTILATLRDTDHLLPSVLACDLDELHVWTADAWRALGRALHPMGTAGRYVTAHEIATLWKLPLGTVHRLAHTDTWDRTPYGKRPTLYLAADVDATMTRRTSTTRRETRQMLTSDPT